MAKFKIYGTNGAIKAEGYPTFTGTYMKPGVLEFREIVSPVPIDWAIGDYVDYSGRTGFRYTLFFVPQVKKQARNGSYGAAYVYQNVQFFDPSKYLELCPFRDLVPGDNRIHFSTQPQIAVFDNVTGIAERIQACLDDMYPGEWVVRVATGTEYDDLMAEDRNFSVSGVSILGALEKVYAIWQNVGWRFFTQNQKNVIEIGGAGISRGSLSYGMGNGLLNISRSTTNSDEFANRLFVYGSSRNMLSRWYSQFNIKDAASVDIQHLMLPISEWGKTDGKPDPAKSYVENVDSISELGLRPKVVYFDGTGDMEEIYPTIQGMTIGDVRGASPDYIPSSRWSDDERVDEVLSVPTTFDDGLAAEYGKTYLVSDSSDVERVISNESDAWYIDIALFTKTISTPESGKLVVSAGFALNGAISCDEATKMRLDIIATSSGSRLLSRSVALDQDSDGNWPLSGIYLNNEKLELRSGQVVSISVHLIVFKNASGEGTMGAITGTVTGQYSASVWRYREKTFQIVLRQIGFDINKQAAIGEGKSIAFKTGKCAGRTFPISQATYQEASDTWLLDVIRTEDESISQWFPNSDYYIAEGDRFVLLDIAMPASFIAVAEMRLLRAAHDYLSWTSKAQWQYIPDIDSEYMVEHGVSILPCDRIVLPDFPDEETPERLVDSVSISENEKLPQYKITLRERKRKTSSDSAPVPEISSKSVANAQEMKANPPSSVVINDTFFEEDGDGGVKLKDEYNGLWAKGYGSFGGIGHGDPGGGGDLLSVWTSLHNNNDDYANWLINARHIPLGSGLTYEIIDGHEYIKAVGGVESVVGLTGAITRQQLNSQIATNAITSGSDMLATSGAVYSYVNTVLSSAIKFKGLTTTELVDGGTNPAIVVDGKSYTAIAGDVVVDGRGFEFLWTGSKWQKLGDDTSYALKTISITGTGYLSGGGTLDANRTIDLTQEAKTKLEAGATVAGFFANGILDKSHLPSMYIGRTAVAFSPANTTLLGINAISNLASSDSSDKSRIEWDETNNAWHFFGNVYADGWGAFGGVGSGGSGGGGIVERIHRYSELGGTFSQTANDVFDAYTVNQLHLRIRALEQSPGGVTSVAGILPVDGDVKTSPLQEALGIDLLGTAVQSLQSQIDSVAARNNYDELSATSLYADVAAAQNLYADSISLDGNDLSTKLNTLVPKTTTVNGHALSGNITLTKSDVGLGNVENTALSTWAGTGNITTLGTITTGVWHGTPIANDYLANKTIGVGNATITLGSSATLTQIGIPAWAQKASLAFADMPAMYIGNARVKSSAQTAQNIGGLGTVTASGLIKTTNYLQGTRLILADGVYLEYDSSSKGVKLVGAGFWTESYVTAGGVGSGGGGGGGVDIDRLWQSLTNNPADAGYENTKIAVAHIPDTATTYGYLKGNQTITLTGVVTGSGTTNIATSIADGALSISKVSGLQAALDGKQSTISDLATIRSNAANGATAYSWGNHASAGYLTSANGTTISQALQSLQSQVDSVAARNMFDELSATVLNADTLTATIAYIGTVNGSLSGNATSASYLVSASYGIGGGLNPIYFSGGRPVASTSTAGSASVPVYLNGGTLTAITPSSLFSALSSSAATNLSVTIAGQGRTIADLYARYDKDGGEIAPNMTTIGTALRSLQSQIDSVASKNEYDELSATILYTDTLSVGAKIEAGGTIHSLTGVWSEGYITAGGIASSSDRRMKDEIEDVCSDRALAVLMQLSPKEWVWNDKNGYFSGKRGAGLVAQDVEAVLPFAVMDSGDYLSLNYTVLHAYEIAGLQNHEERIAELEKENKELKEKLEAYATQ